MNLKKKLGIFFLTNKQTNKQTNKKEYFYTTTYNQSPKFVECWVGLKVRLLPRVALIK